MGEVPCDGFNLEVIYILVMEGSENYGVYSYCLSLLCLIMSSCLRHYSVLYELNTLDACWIMVDVWSNSSRCRQELVYLTQT